LRMLFYLPCTAKLIYMDAVKFDFIQHKFTPLLNNLSTNTAGKWGKMNAQQMAEHLILVFQSSSGKITAKLATPEEHLPKYKEFLWSNKEFRENTKAPAGLVPEEPAPLQHASMQMALAELRHEINYFIDYFENHTGATTMHPVFGTLNFEEWVQIHHKHLLHHGKQFEVIE
jgi:hypothetical protein